MAAFLRTLAVIAACLAAGLTGNLIGYEVTTFLSARAEAPACGEPACICRVGEDLACARVSGLACMAWVRCPKYRQGPDGLVEVPRRRK